MFIECFTTSNLNELELELYTSRLHYNRQFLQPPDENGMLRFDRNAKARIKFYDTQEVDMLIRMLQDFKRKNTEYFGCWAEV